MSREGAKLWGRSELVTHIGTEDISMKSLLKILDGCWISRLRFSFCYCYCLPALCWRQEMLLSRRNEPQEFEKNATALSSDLLSSDVILSFSQWIPISPRSHPKTISPSSQILPARSVPIGIWMKKFPRRPTRKRLSFNFNNS